MTQKLALEKFIAPNNIVKSINHLLDKTDSHALWAAYAAGCPLLLTGKPGTGKSQLAKAIAHQLGWAFVSEVIQGNTELDDLHWHFDAIGRLGDAQVHGDADDVKTRLNPINYLSPGAFWWAYHWASAEKHYNADHAQRRPKPDEPTHSEWNAKNGGVVLLIDEIDKADPDLPNGLLETLGLYQFTVPYVNEKNSEVKNPIKATPDNLLIIITTNEERALPNAFVRRCFVHHLAMETSTELNEKGIEKRHAWLIARGKVHFDTKGHQHGVIDPEVYQEAAKMLWHDRDENPHAHQQPGLAEYIDLLRALSSLHISEQFERLKLIASYALKKSSET